MTSKLARFLPAAVLAAVAVAFYASGAAAHLSPRGLLEHGQAWRAGAVRHPLQAITLFLPAFAVLAAAGLPVAMILTVLAGVLFGPVFGGLAAVAGAALAAMLGYGAARSLFGEHLSAWLIRARPRVGATVDRLREGGFWPVVSARLFPAMPFALVNLAAGAARIRPATFLTASIVGGLPSAFIFAALGSGVVSQAATETFSEASRSPKIWLPLLALSFLSLLPFVLARRRAATS
jgi:uncharacterized membrane protein YdjX (TVP38/TMEM64 family)